MCCGGSPPPKSSPHARAGYRLERFVERFLQVEDFTVPVASTRPASLDHLGTIGARLGVHRNNYLVSPGLYAVGNPGQDSPVMATANYKLSFDSLRFALDGIDAWILVLDTCGINVWCAAGKKTFSTEELVDRIISSSLVSVVAHGKIIIPQLGATGVLASEVKKRSGFSVCFGPVRAKDLRHYLQGGCRADETMRSVSFTMTERLVLIPVEGYALLKKLLWLLPLLLIASGIGEDWFSSVRVWERGLQALLATFAGIAAGVVIVPLLLPWIPGRSFAVKGLCAGLALGLLHMALATYQNTILEQTGLLCWTAVVGSYLGMNFTGSTPFTSLSGVEWEMRRAIPAQIGGVICAAVCWLIPPFL